MIYYLKILKLIKMFVVVDTRKTNSFLIKKTMFFYDTKEKAENFVKCNKNSDYILYEIGNGTMIELEWVEYSDFVFGLMNQNGLMLDEEYM